MALKKSRFKLFHMKIYPRIIYIIYTYSDSCVLIYVKGLMDSFNRIYWHKVGIPILIGIGDRPVPTVRDGDHGRPPIAASTLGRRHITLRPASTLRRRHAILRPL
jgi:hypothetical protein